MRIFITLLLSILNVLVISSTGRANTHIGTEFMFSIPPSASMGEVETNAYIYVFSLYGGDVTLQREDTDILIKKTIKHAGQELFILEKSDSYPSTKKKANTPLSLHKKAAIHITSESPAMVYVILKTYDLCEGFLALPINSLGNKYIVTTYRRSASTCIVAIEDETKVNFKMGGNNNSQTDSGLKPYESESRNLDRGDVWKISATGDYADVSGSLIESDKSVAVISGNENSYVPGGNGTASNYLVEMQTPVMFWGKEHIVPYIKNVSQSPYLRAYARLPNVDLFRNDKFVAALSEAGGVDGKAFKELTSTMNTNDKKPSLISGSNPFGLMLFNKGKNHCKEYKCRTFQMTVPSVRQFYKEVYFGIPDFNIVSDTAENGDHDVYLTFETESDSVLTDRIEIAKIDNFNSVQWKPIQEEFGNGFDSVEVKLNGKKYGMKMLRLHDPGIYGIRSEKPFMAYIHGRYSLSFYAYPAGLKLNKLYYGSDVYPPKPVYEEVCGETKPGAYVVDMPPDDKIRSNLSAIILDDDYSYNYSFSYDHFLPGRDPSTSWNIKVKDKMSDAKAKLTFFDKESNDTTVYFEYHAPEIEMNPNNFNLGSVDKGDTKIIQFSILNKADTYPITITDVSLKENNEFMTLIDSPLPKELGSFNSVNIKVEFTPLIAGDFKDTMVISNECVSMNLGMITAEVEEPIIRLTDAEFGETEVGSNAEMEMSIYNEGDAELIIRSIDGPQDTAAFSHSLPQLGVDDFISIKPHTQLDFTVNFKAFEEKVYEDSLVFISNADGIDSAAYLRGQGIVTSIAENITLEDFQPKIFPNPANDNINIKIYNEKAGDIRFSIIDIMGNEVYKEKQWCSKGIVSERISLENLGSGSYHLRIILPNGKIKISKFNIIR